MKKRYLLNLAVATMSSVFWGGATAEELTFENHVSLSPSGEHVVIHGRPQGLPNLYIKTVNSEKFAHYLGDDTTIAQEPRWSPDGRFIAFVSGKNYQPGSLQLHMVNFQTKEVTKLTEYADFSVKGPSWSPDSKQILFEVRNASQGKSHLAVIDLETRQTKPITNQKHGMLVNAEWSPDGKQILAVKRDPKAQSNSDLWLFSLHDMENPKRLTETEEGEVMPVWHPSGKGFAFSKPAQQEQYDVFYYSLDSGKVTQITHTLDSSEYFPLFSAYGAKLYFDRFVKTQNGYSSKIAWTPFSLAGRM